MQPATALPILFAISFCHLLNDMMQSLLPAMYPMLKADFALTFAQVGLITFTFQLTASLLQPLIGLYTDHHPKPYSLMAGMGFTLVGLLFLSVTRSYHGLLVAAGLVGTRLGGLPSGVVAGGAHGVGRTARVRAVAVSGRRQHRLADRAAAGGVHRAAARPEQRRVVLRRGPAGDPGALERRQLVPRGTAAP